MLSELAETFIRSNTWDNQKEHLCQCNICGTYYYSPLELYHGPYGALHTKKTKPCPICGHREH